MISHLSGTIIESSANSVMLDVGGVGYRIFVSPDTALRLGEEGSGASLWTHLAVRETSLELFGFLDRGDLALFEMLITISGIGPKSGLAILSVAPAETLRTAIASGDTSYLTKVSGIGRKTAEKIVLELRDKISVGTGSEGAELKADSDVVEVLKSLGYSQQEAREAVKKIPSEVQGTSERVKEALKKIS